MTRRRPTVYTLNVGAGPIALALTRPTISLPPPPPSPIVTTSVPERPLDFKGTIKKLSRNASLLARWRPSSSPNVVKYEIFSLNNYVTSIPAKDMLCFQAPLIGLSVRKHHGAKKRLRRLAKAFRIRAVDTDGHVSPFTILKVKHL
jgi:hypothetical protein